MKRRTIQVEFCGPAITYSDSAFLDRTLHDNLGGHR